MENRQGIRQFEMEATHVSLTQLTTVEQII